MSLYASLFYLHVSTVILSGSFFLVRGIWMIQESPLLTTRLVRIAPHIIDTLLLSAAIGLAVITRQYPFVADWLTVKLVALFAYIVLGIFALRRGRNRSQRLGFLIAALATFGFMVSVALTREPAGFLAALL